MTDLKFVIDIDKMDWNDMESMMSSNPSLIRPIMARFMVDAGGNPIPPAEADTIIKRVPVRQMADVARNFRTLFDDAFLNPTNDGE